MTPEQLIERIEKRVDWPAPHLVKARSLASEAWRLGRGDERYYALIREAQDLMKGAQS